MTANTTGTTGQVSEPDWSKVRMVVLDRDGAFVIAVKRALASRQLLDIFCTTSPDEVLRYLRTGDVHIILMGMQRADTRAAEFLARLRTPAASPCPDIPVLVFVPPSEPSAAAKATAYGIEAVLSKAISPQELLAKVAATVLKPRHGIAPVSFAPPAKVVATPPPAQPSPPPQPAQPQPQIAPTPPSPPPPPAPEPRPKAREFVEPPLPPAPTPTPSPEDNRVELPPPPETKPKVKHSASDWAQEVAAKSGKRVRRNTQSLNVDEILKEHLLWLKSQGTMGKRAELAGADLSCCFLEGANLTNANLQGADLSDSNLSKANLNGADLRHAKLQGAVINDANLGVAKLRHVDFSLSHLHDTNLRGADLSGASFRGVNVNEADFTGAIFLDTDVTDADLSLSKGLSQSQCNRARANMSTKLPPGLTRKLAEVGGR